MAPSPAPPPAQTAGSSSGGVGAPAPPPPPSSAAAGSKPGVDPLALFAGAMPKSEIGALRFLAEHPQYDGRGVVVAIFDTGIDPSAAGLQVTTDGKPKIIDLIDCTGSGDVDTSTVVTADEAGCIQGASGRRLALNPGWTNPSGRWHVGCRRLFDLFPKPLQNRVKEQRKKAFDEAQRRALADATAALRAASNGSSGNGSSGAAAAAGQAAAGAGKEAGAAPAAAPAAAAGPDSKPGGPAAPAASKAELEARVAYLQEAYKAYDDPGPVVDCVVWHDGATWRVALDTSDMHMPPYATSSSSGSGSGNDSSSTDGSSGNDEAGAQAVEGRLANYEPLADFAVERQHRLFSGQDGCAYGVKVYDDGDTLSLVVDAGAHGTHVAGIVAAHFPEDPAANGVAPGAQLISCKIGDSRLGSMETGTGMVRALAAVMEAKADLINMSYGEPAARPNVGRVIDLASEVVDKAGVIFVSSAGNAGPALGTVGAPGGTSSALLGIGAYVTPELALAGHSLRDGLAAGLQYTWSSRGPAADGDIGVVLSAPGGAIAPVPGWTLQRRQLMNGTSMASPCAAGGIALLLSGLKALQGEGGQWVSPARVRRAVEATAAPLGGASPDAALTYGRGLLQVDAAFNYLLKTAELDKPDVRFVVSVSGGPGSSAGLGVARRGVYMRQPHEAAGPATYTVTVTPTLHEDAPVGDKLSIEEHLVLSTTVPWVAAPQLLLLHHNGRSFELRVDPTSLAPGLHYAELHATLPGQEWRGPLFRVPVTVIKPQDLLRARDIDPEGPAAAAAAVVVQTPSGGGGAAAAVTDGGGGGGGALPPHTLRLGPLALAPGQEVRHFVAVPPGATWGELLVRAGGYDTPRVFLIRATQVVPDVRYTDSELRTNLTLSPNSEWSIAFKVVGEASLELTLSQFWSSLGPSSIEVELSFHGLGVAPATAATSSAAAAAPDTLTLDAAAGPLKLLVSCPLRRQRVKPEARLTSLALPLRPKEATLEPLLDPRDALPGGRVAYRLVLQYAFSLTEGGTYKAALPLTNGYLYDSPLDSQLTQLFDGRGRLLYTGDAVPEEVALLKGDHTARVCLRHDAPGVLDKLKATCLVLSRRLEPPVAVPVYGSHAAAVTGGSAVGETFLSGGDKCVLWLGAPPEDKLPKDAAGRLLHGSLSLGQLRRGPGAAPAATPITFCPPPPAPKKDAAGDASGSGSSSKSVPPEQRLSEALRDARLAVYKGLRPEGPGTEGEGQPGEAALADQLERELLADFPTHLPLLLEIMRRRDAAAKGDARVARLPAVVSAASAVIAAIDTTALAAFLALRAPPEDDDAAAAPAAAAAAAAATGTAVAASGVGAAAPGSSGGSNGSSSSSYKEAKAARDKEKAALLEALRVMLKAQLDLAQASPGDAAAAAAVSATAAQLRQWVDTASDKEYLLLHARVEAAAGRYAAALVACDKLLAPADEVPGPGAPEAGEAKAAALRALGWGHWAAYEAAWARVKLPPAPPPL